jgi:REP element-mobilizing transposase RayT
MRARGEDCFRLVHYSVQSNHLHLVCEARDRSELSRALQSLAIRIAKRLNHLWHRAGQLFADRDHDHILRTPREVRNALAYVLNNAARHGMTFFHGEPDTCSSAAWSDARRSAPVGSAPHDGPICAARTWLLAVG